MGYNIKFGKRTNRVVLLLNDNELAYFKKYQELVDAPTLNKAIRDAVWTQYVLHAPRNRK